MVKSGYQWGVDESDGQPGRWTPGSTSRSITAKEPPSRERYFTPASYCDLTALWVGIKDMGHLARVRAR